MAGRSGATRWSLRRALLRPGENAGTRRRYDDAAGPGGRSADQK